ncbi:hypothetical protein DPMN_007181 [Dreissena polymorpha]|uniref:Uncharacterized protein n=1 Tax=Dreissena polymorpha TaxID=45954 RepID=A0A9D4MY13_DREPO|nr:hypothetical protein DPMN_007181 [Dreissena polymorpha]
MTANGHGISRRSSVNTQYSRCTPCITREGSQESDVIEFLQNVNTTASLNSMAVQEEEEHSNSIS